MFTVLYWRGNETPLAESVANARYFACLIDGSTGSSVTEQEVVCSVFFDSGVPVFKYVTKESVENADAEGMQKSIENVIGGFAKK